MKHSVRCQNWLHEYEICACAQGSEPRRAGCFIPCSAITVLNFLILLEQEALPFHFALGSALARLEISRIRYG